MKKARKRRFGDRKEGRYLRELDAYYGLTPFIMKTRTDSQNYFSDCVEISETDRFLRAKRREGYPGLGILHLFVAAYVRTVSQKPAINRFVSGQRIYARDNIEFVMSIKKEMKSDAGETSIVVYFEPEDTIFDVYNKMNAEIDLVKDGEETETGDLANAFMKIPRPILKFIIWFIEKLDYFGGLPKFLLKGSPFHGSMIITDLGSLGIPPIYHHLYNFGNLPVFLSFGAKRRENELQSDGSIKEKKYIDFMAVVDERICDGFYFAQAFKLMKSYLRKPEQLEQPPETVFEDMPTKSISG